MDEVIGEYIDRLCTVEMRPARGNLPRGYVRSLHEAARADAGAPLAAGLAAALAAAARDGGAVLLVTGAGGPPILPRAEVDGILGAAVLARAAHWAWAAAPVILAEEHAGQPIAAAVRALGLNTRRRSDARQAHDVTLEAMPLDAEACARQADDLLDHYQPFAVVAIEKTSPNRQGVIVGSTGVPCHEIHGNPQFLFQAAADRGILTAGIGDGGNEVGFGRIPEAVERIMPAGRKTAAVLATNHLVVAAVSDWGAYGVAASLAYQRGQLDLAVSADEVERALRACVDAGALDGVTARPTLSDDGIPLEAQRAFVTMLQAIVTIGLSNVESPGH